jgi:spore coat protein U-like protein
MRARIPAALLAVAVAGLPAPASALLCGTVLAPVRVTTTGLSFGTYAPGAGNRAINGTLTIDCGLITADLLPNFTISLSSGNGANPTARYMLRGTTHLNYNLYTTNAHTSVWGDAGGGVKQTYSSTLTLGSINYTVYGLIFGAQFVTPGLYTDSLTVTVDY